MEFALAVGGIILAASTGWIVAGIGQLVRVRARARVERDRIREYGRIESKRLELDSRRLDDEVYRDFASRRRPD